ncbi:nocturnin isoform X2 [Onthophagus taurus]|uniref:nocturnin isoform X2 n=1 Tax=Onthophagus taurus TaxID=166361 RepID=UPI000C20801A|nr:nocturnin isoform X2 [Onthophagus taurus]
MAGRGSKTLGFAVRNYARLLALPRMGSFNSAPKILNSDCQDEEVRLPEGISRHELIQFCQKHKQHYPLFKRSFRKAKEPYFSDYGIKYRKLNSYSKGCSDYISTPSTLRVFQWNVLAQALGRMNDNFARCPVQALDWESRKYKMVEEIVQYCPDVICLQEVDHFNYLKYVLGTQGYSGTFFPKPDSPCVYIDGNNGPDGCAIFYRTDKFDLLQFEYKVLEIWKVQSNQVALLVILKLRGTDQEICITTTHLKARTGVFLSTFRNEQGKDLIDFVSSHCGNRPVVLCGDFNAEPSEPVYSTVTNNSFLDLSSAYADCQPPDVSPCEPPYTTWKIRDEGEICHTIDYIFYSRKKLEVDAVLELPSGEDIGEDRVPSFCYPSDHFSLCTDFKLLC